MAARPVPSAPVRKIWTDPDSGKTYTKAADVFVGQTLTERPVKGKAVTRVVSKIRACRMHPGYLHYEFEHGWAWCIHPDTTVEVA